MVRSFPRPVVAMSIISLFSVINPVSAHVNTPFRPRAHAAIQQRSFDDDADLDFTRSGDSPFEVRELSEKRGLVSDVVGVANTVLSDSVNGVTSVVNSLVGGGTTTTTSNPPANSTPATSQPQGENSSGTTSPAHPTTSNTQNDASATASNPNQQTPKASSGTTDANGSTVVAGTGSLTRSPGASTMNPTDSAFPQNAMASGTGNEKFTIVQTITHFSTLPDGSVSTSIEVTTSTVGPRNGNNHSGDGDKGPSPVLIGVVVSFFVLLLVVGIGLFVWRRRKRKAIRRSPSSGSASDGNHHVRDSTMVGLGGSAASMGSGGVAVPEMTEGRTSGTIAVDPFAYSRHALSGRSYSPSLSSSHGSPDTSNIRIPPDQSPVLAKFSQYPVPGTYTAFAIAPDSSSEGHSSQHDRSAADHYEASTETLDPTHEPPSVPTTEQSFHAAFREERRVINPTQRLSESIQTPRASVINPFGDGAQVPRPSVDSGASIVVGYMRPVAPSPFTSTFGPSGEPQPSSPFVTGTGRDAESVRNSYLIRKESFATAKSNKTGSTITLSPAPTRQARGGSVSATSTTSTDEFYSAASHESRSLSQEHETGNGQTSSSGHYITAPENPFADPSPQPSSEDTRYSTASQASEASAASHSVSVHAHVVQHRGTSARAEVLTAMPLRPPLSTLPLRPATGQSSSGHSIISSEADPEAARCVSPDESELFYRPLPTHRERDQRPSDETAVAEDSRRTISAKAMKILGVDT